MIPFKPDQIRMLLLQADAIDQLSKQYRQTVLDGNFAAARGHAFNVKRTANRITQAISIHLDPMSDPLSAKKTRTKRGKVRMFRE